MPLQLFLCTAGWGRGSVHAKSSMVAETRHAVQGRNGLQCLAQTEIVLAGTFNPYKRNYRGRKMEKILCLAYGSRGEATGSFLFTELTCPILLTQGHKSDY